MDVQTSSTGRDFWVSDTSATPSEHHLPAFADGDDSPSFKDVLDVINPLQHIPIISTVYRELTGDQPGGMSRLAGGLLYGGPVGLVFGMIDTAVDDSTGHDIGGHVWAALFGDDTTETTKVASDTDSTTESPKSPTPDMTAKTEQSSAAQITSLIDSHPVAETPAAPAPAIKDSQDDKTVDQAPHPLVPKLLASASASPPNTQTTGTATSATGSPLPTGFMPAPIRRSVQVSQPMPAGAYVTTSNQRSNMPAAGRVIAHPSQTDARGIAVSQAGDKPMAVQPIASPPPPAAPNAWLPDAMAKALDKYEQMNKLNKTAQPSAAQIN